MTDQMPFKNPRCDTAHYLVEAQVDRTPDSVAVEFEGNQLTFAELESLSNKVAHHLRATGAGPDVPVALCLDRSLDMLVGLLGILKSGAAYVPLDPAYPTARLGYMLADSQAQVVLTESELVRKLPDHRVRTVCLDTDQSVIAGCSAHRPASTVSGSDLAYIIYTSGSTGRPKGVEIPHRAVVNLLCSMRYQPGLTPNDRLLAVTTISFDIAVLDLFLTLIVGARLILVPRSKSYDGIELARTLAEKRATMMQATPTTWRLLLDAGWEGDAHFRILCGGETLPQDLAVKLRTRCCELWNLYGPTETTVWSTAQRLEPDQTGVHIGFPIANTEIHLLDEHRQPVNAGSPGEIYIGGAGLARGYRNLPKLTEERFIPHPAGVQPDARLYRTGDLGRICADGSLEHLGRIDHQVKVRGFRIELGEIEAVLEQQAEIRRAIVMAREDLPGDKQLVAYLVMAPEQTTNPAVLREKLCDSLPDYMIPVAFVSLDQVPLTPNGKVDRNALPAPGPQRLSPVNDFVAPHTSSEVRLTELCAEVLRVERVGMQDNLLVLGADSIKLAQIVARVRESFNVEVPVRLLFEKPKVADLISSIESFQPGEAGTLQEPIELVPRTGRLPLSFSQERIWFFHQLNPDSLAYNFQSTIRFRGLLDTGCLERSLTEIVRRHEIYRTTFENVEGQPTQCIHPPAALSLPIVDLSEIAESEQQTMAGRWCEQEFQTHFDLTRLPLVRWTLLKFNQNDHVLVHMDHHLVHDGWSFNVFLREMVEIYSAFSADQPSPLPELPIQFADFAMWQRRSLQGSAAEPQLAYWQRQLSGMPALLELPADHSRPKSQTYRGRAPRTELPLDLCRSLRRLSRQQGNTLFMTMFTGFVILIHRYTHRTDVPIGTFFANRRRCESESLIGMILNNVVIRTSLASDPTVSELFRQVRDLILEATGNQDVPFDQVVHSVKVRRDPSFNPLFQITFGFHDEPMPEKGPPGLDIEVTPVISNGSAKFDLGVIVVPNSAQRIGLNQGSEADGLTMIWEYNGDLFDEATITRMTANFTRLLAAMVTDSEMRISTLPLLTTKERRQLLLDWSRTTVDRSRPQGVHELFERQAESTPDAVAVVLEGEQLTYAELNTRANQLAHYLCALGIGSKALIGLCVERSLEMIVGILGILKTGGIYVPLDPEYPHERLAFMLADARIPMVLTQVSLLDRLPGLSGQVICLDRDWQTIRAQSSDNAGNGLIPEDIAYVIYTSGSTGEPKGVAVPHSAISRNCRIMAGHYRLRCSDRVLQFSRFSFDQSLDQILLPLSCGASVVLPGGNVVDPVQLTTILSRHKITVMNLPPAYWRQWVQVLSDRGAQAYHPVLRLVIVGGDVITSDSVRMWNDLSISQSIELLNAYGPTEATVTATTYAIRGDPESEVVPIGRPIPGRSTYILDRHLQPVPIGVAGELHIGGTLLARGYLDRPQLTAEKFVPDPFSDDPEARLYKTGDLARYRPDGNIEFLGRLDQQVKIRGFRIELEEIEAVLRLHPGVSEAVVNVHEPNRGGKRLAAYVVADSDLVPADSELRRFLKQKLPDYMLPSVFMQLDALPLTPNGKVDRKALPDPKKGRPEELKRDFVGARTEVEQKLVDIWSELLGVERVGVNNNFFELGGHSLIAMQINDRIRSMLNTELPLRTLFELPTIRELAEVITHSD